MRCGAAARTRLAAIPNWRAPVIALSAVIVLSLGALTAALVSLAGDSPTPPPRTGASTLPATTATTPAATIGGAGTQATSTPGTTIPGAGAATTAPAGTSAATTGASGAAIHGGFTVRTSGTGSVSTTPGTGATTPGTGAPSTTPGALPRRSTGSGASGKANKANPLEKLTREYERLHGHATGAPAK